MSEHSCKQDDPQAGPFLLREFNQEIPQDQLQAQPGRRLAGRGEAVDKCLVSRGEQEFEEECWEKEDQGGGNQPENWFPRPFLKKEKGGADHQDQAGGHGAFRLCETQKAQERSRQAEERGPVFVHGKKKRDQSAAKEKPEHMIAVLARC